MCILLLSGASLPHSSRCRLEIRPLWMHQRSSCPRWPTRWSGWRQPLAKIPRLLYRLMSQKRLSEDRAFSVKITQIDSNPGRLPIWHHLVLHQNCHALKHTLERTRVLANSASDSSLCTAEKPPTWSHSTSVRNLWEWSGDGSTTSSTSSKVWMFSSEKPRTSMNGGEFHRSEIPSRTSERRCRDISTSPMVLNLPLAQIFFLRLGNF